MNKIMIKYHPVKKEIHFLVDDNGAFDEIEYTDSPYFEKYASQNGEFLLQNQGKQFFDDLRNSFLNINEKTLIFKGTKIDYLDFIQMVNNYNNIMKRGNKKVEIKVGELLELPEVSSIYEAIKEVSNETVRIFENELPEGTIKETFRTRRKTLDEKIHEIEKDNVNICFVGTYSSGKSAFINALIGERILPEDIRAETAKMFRIQNAELPSIRFTVKRDHSDDKGSKVEIFWDEKSQMFQFLTSVNDGIKGKIDAVCQEYAGKPRYYQVRSILAEVNQMPNGYKNEDKNFIDGMIDVEYPMDLTSDINFTFYDTPGTDSNSSEHLRILKEALARQTNSILIVMYEPTKMEGRGNSVLYGLMQKTQEDISNEEGITIDLERSLHVINQADRFTQKELVKLLERPIKVSMNEKDVLDESETEELEYNLERKRTFYVSSKAAYCAKAKKKHICDEEDDEFIRDTADKVLNNCYYKRNHMSDSEFETNEIISASQAKLDGLPEEDRYGRMYIASGMYAVEQEIIKYAEKYALVVKAKSLYDAVLYVMEGVESEYKMIEHNLRSKKEDLQRQINVLKEKMVSDINQCVIDFQTAIDEERLETIKPELDKIQNQVTKVGKKATRKIKTFPKIAIKREKIDDKNKAILKSLNGYIGDLDNNYYQIREKILSKQMMFLKAEITKKIREYKEIPRETIDRILSIGKPQIPKSTIRSVKMEDYINPEKALWIFTTTDKDDYTETVRSEFLATSGRQYDNYLKEIKEVAKKKAREMSDEFIKNIGEVSTALESLINKNEKVEKEQKEAKGYLDMAADKIDSLEKKIWRAENE